MLSRHLRSEGLLCWLRAFDLSWTAGLLLQLLRLVKLGLEFCIWARRTILRGGFLSFHAYSLLLN